MINTYSNPTDLKITDMRFVDIDGAPKRCTILKIMTNQGITGYGEVRDASSKTYALNDININIEAGEFVFIVGTSGSGKTSLLKLLLKEKGISQTELAENVGVSQAMISYIVKGFKAPSVTLLKRISDYLGVTMDELVQ